MKRCCAVLCCGSSTRRDQGSSPSPAPFAPTRHWELGRQPRPEQGFDSRSHPTGYTAGVDRGCHSEWRVRQPACRSPSRPTGLAAGAALSTANARLSSSVAAAAVACARCARCWVPTAATRWAWPRRRLRACRWGDVGRGAFTQVWAGGD